MVQQRKDDLSLAPLSFDQWSSNNNKGASSTQEKEASTKSYRRVMITGRFDHNNAILVGPRGPPPGALATTGPNSGMGGGGGMSSSMQGYWVVTPFIIGEKKSQSFSGGEEEVETKSVELNGGKEDKKGMWGRLLFWNRRNDNTSPAKSNHECCNNMNSESSTTTTTSSNDKPTTVWINRGWIPRHYINQNTNQVLQSWDEPSGHDVTLLSMESQMEKGGGMFTPPSRIDAVVAKKNIGEASSNSSIIDKKIVRKLLWMDRKAMEEMTNIGGSSDDEHPPLFVQINTDTTTETTNEPKSFPVQPSEEYVGEFKVTPDVHMGYAVTWFGLSGAGVVMTRKLLTRGR